MFFSTCDFTCGRFIGLGGKASLGVNRQADEEAGMPHL
jgi:hypothetical protein